MTVWNSSLTLMSEVRESRDWGAVLNGLSARLRASSA